MKDYKIKDFQTDHPGKNFPEYQHIEGDELERIQQSAFAKLALPTTSAGVSELVKTIDSRSQIIPAVNADVDGFILSQVLENLGLAASEYVFVNWHRFDDIDRLRLQDLSDYFWDIWYPGADDIDVFPENLSWILSVAHDGYLKLLRLSN